MASMICRIPGIARPGSRSPARYSAGTSTVIPRKAPCISPLRSRVAVEIQPASKAAGCERQDISASPFSVSHDRAQSGTRGPMALHGRVHADAVGLERPVSCVSHSSASGSSVIHCRTPSTGDKAVEARSNASFTACSTRGGRAIDAHHPVTRNRYYHEIAGPLCVASCAIVGGSRLSARRVVRRGGPAKACLAVTGCTAPRLGSSAAHRAVRIRPTKRRTCFAASPSCPSRS